MADELDRLFELLVHTLSREARLAVPFPAAEIYERLVPYRSNRSALRVASHQDYEMAVLRLLAGERDYVRLDPDDVREGLQREVTSINPESGIFRHFPDARVLVNRIAAERFLRGEAAYAPPTFRPAEPAFDAAAGEEADGADEEEVEVTWIPAGASPAPGSLAPGPAPAGAKPTFELDESEAGPASRHCPYCGGALPGNRKVNFCPHCGQPPSGELKCPACGAEVDVGWAYCIGCGRPTGFE